MESLSIHGHVIAHGRHPRESLANKVAYLPDCWRCITSKKATWASIKASSWL